MNSLKIYLIVIMLTCLCGCKKYLDWKPDKAMVIPSKLSELQAIMDNSNQLNIGYPSSGEVASDDYYLLFADWNSLSLTDRNNYIWDKEMFQDEEVTDWSRMYTIVYYANVVLDNLHENFNGGYTTELRQIKGGALFFRSYAFFNLLSLFAPPYADTANSQPGIVLRLSSDLNVPSRRSALRECYDQVIGDLKEAASLLSRLPAYPTQPSKASSYALLSRIYLSMRRYSDALAYTDSALAIKSDLMDYNMLNANGAYPIELSNKEVLFHSVMRTSPAINNSRAKIDSVLYDSYDRFDKRKSVFFRNNGNGSYAFKGSYGGSSTLFNGLATNELYLTKAECLARKEKTEDALETLNFLLMQRYEPSNFIPVTASSSGEAIKKILKERRKELIMRGLRWIDLRRLNKESDYQTTLTRILNGNVITLPPNHDRYVIPIPANVISMSGIAQNP